MSICAAACSAKVVVPEDGSTTSAGGEASTGGGGAGDSDGAGGSGGEAPVARTIEIRHSAPAASGEGIAVFINDSNGGLRASFDGTELPVQAEVVDGDLVSFLDIEGQRMRSLRVSPAVSVVASGDPFYDFGGCDFDGEPMTVTVSFPKVAGASRYTVDASAVGGYVPGPGHAFSSEPGEETFSVESCKDTFDLFAVAEGESLISYQIVRDIPYIAGGAVTVPLTLADTARALTFVDIGPLEGVERVTGRSRWESPPQMFAPDGPELERSNPPAFITYAPELIQPGGEYGFAMIWLNTTFLPHDQGTSCETASYETRVLGGTSHSYDPLRLAGVRADDLSGYTLTGGSLGDEVQRLIGYDADSWIWEIAEDPTQPSVQLVFPDLPEGASWSSSQPELNRLTHRDYSSIEGFGELAGAPTLPWDLTVETRLTSPCD